MKLKSGATIFWAILIGLLLVVYAVFRLSVASDTITATLHDHWGSDIKITSKQNTGGGPSGDITIVYFDVWHGGRWEQHASQFLVSKKDGECRFISDIPFVPQKK